MKFNMNIAHIWVSMCIISLASCSDESVSFNDQIQVSGVVATDSKLVYLDYTNNEALVIDALNASAQTQRITLPQGPIYAEKRNSDADAGVDEVLVLGWGSEGSKESKEEEATLTRLNSEGTTVTYGLGFNPFDTLVQDPEGRFVFLLRRGNSNMLIQNLNELAVVDLSQTPDSNNAVVVQTLEAQPYNFFFSEQFKIADQERKLACVASLNILFLIDLEHLNRTPTTVYLGTEDDSQIMPEQVIFDTNSSRIYVRSENSNDLFTLRLSPREVDPNRNDFATSMDIVAVGDSPSDMELYYENDESHLAVVSSRKKEAYFVDAATSKTWSVNLPDTFDEILYFEKQNMDTTTKHALLWSPGSNSFYVMDFLNLEVMQSQNIRKIGQSEVRAEELMVALEGNRLLLLHKGRGISIIDLDQEIIEPFSTKKYLSDAAFDMTRNQFWVGPSGQKRIAYVNIENGKTDELVLDENIDSIIPLFESGKLAAVHKGALGAVTVIDVDTPSRESAFMVRGFLMEQSI